MYSFKTLILGSDKESITSVGEHLQETYRDKIFMTYIRLEFEEYLEKNNPDIFLIDLSSQLSDAEKKNIIESVRILREKYPSTVMMTYGSKKTMIKEKGFQDAIDCFSGKTIAKIGKDYEEMRRRAVVKGNNLIAVLTGFFAPYLIGKYDQPAFDRLLNQTYSREENLEILDDLKESFQLFAPLLQDKNRKMLESALEIYSSRDLTVDEIETIQNTFFFQFTTLTAMENFIDRRRYYAEGKVIEDVWESTIEFAREVENSILFGCHKLGDIVHLKISLPSEYDVNQITAKSKFYRKLEGIEPYGTMTIRSGDQSLCIGSCESFEGAERVEGIVFDIRIKVVVPPRGRRGLKRRL
jgi:hypothetical protein